MPRTPDPDRQTCRRRSAGQGLALAVALLLTATGSAWGQTTSPVDDAKAKAVARLTAAERARDQAEALQRHADYPQATTRDANLASTWQRAEKLLQTARDALHNADTKPAANAYRDAGILANGSRRSFEEVALRIQHNLKAIEKERQPPEPPPSAVDEAAAAQDPVSATPSPPPPSPAASAGTEDGDTSPSTDGSSQDRTRRSTDDRPTAPPPAKTTPADKPRQGPRLTSAAPPLRRAITAFFRGDDPAVLEALKDPRQLGAGEQQAHALMLRSAARYNLYLLAGEKDYAQRSAAVEDAIACHRLSPGLEPSRDLFSPRFIDFFENTH